MKFRFIIPFIFLFTFAVKAQENEIKMKPREIKLLIDSVSLALTRMYIYPDKANMISKALKEKYKTGAYEKVNDRQELASMIHGDIQRAHHDGHMRLMYAPGFEKALLT